VSTPSSVYEQIKFWSPVIGVGGFLMGIIFWFRGLKESVMEIKDNHLSHIEANTGQMKDDLRELVGYLKAKSEDGKI
jgi:hypothetical protein